MSAKHRKKKDKEEGEEEEELQNVEPVIECSFSPPSSRLEVPHGVQRERLHASSGDEPRSIHIGDIMAKRKQLKQLEKEQKKQQRFGSAAAAAAAEDSSTTSSSSSPLSLGSMSPSELLRLSEMIEQGDDYRSPFNSSQGSLSPRQPMGFGAYARSDSDSSSRLGRSPHHTPPSPEYEAMSPKSISPKRKGQGKKDGKGHGKGGVGGGMYRRTKSKRKMHSTFSKKRHTRGKRRHSRHSHHSRK